MKAPLVGQRWGTRRAKWAKLLFALGHRGTARSRQDEPKEVGEVGSKRISSSFGGQWGGLICHCVCTGRWLIALGHD
jgi:hypothetical protein